MLLAREWKIVRLPVLGGLVICALVLALTTQSITRSLGQNRANLAFLRATLSTETDPQAQELSIATQVYSEEGVSGYRLAQVVLAPIRSCPEWATAASGGNEAFTLSEAETVELAHWVEDSSVIPICLERGDLDKATEYYAWSAAALSSVSSHYTKLPTKLAEAFIQRAYTRYDAGDKANAAQDWARASIYLESKPFEAFGDIAERLATQHRGAQQSFLNQDLATNSSNSAVRIYLAQAYNAGSQGAEALRIIAPLLTALPQDTRVWQQQGQALVGLHRLAEAEVALQKAVSLAPNDLQAQNRLGVFYLSTGDNNKAESAFRAALAAPGGADAYWVWDHLGDALQKEGRLNEAATAYRSALAIAALPAAFEAAVSEKLSELSK